jgi:hypothetical protein
MSTMRIFAVTVLAGALTAAGLSQAQPVPGFADAGVSRDYAPAWPAGSAQAFSLQACQAGKGYTIALARYKCKGAQLSMGRDEDAPRNDVPLNVRIGAKSFRANLGQLEVFKSDGVPFLDSVHLADLNGDGEQDMVLEFSYHGNGLAAIRRVMGFVLSGPAGYRLLALDNLLAPGAAQWVKDKQSGAVRMMLGRMSADVSEKELEAKDGKSHTFFVFEAIGFSAQANATLLPVPEFAPVYVQYTYARKTNPAQRATRLLSEQQIRAHWKNAVTGIKPLAMQAFKE